MALIVKKFGGTSVSGIDRIKGVAERVAKSHREGNRVMAVLSAMAGETDKLISLAHEASDHPVEKEFDVLVSTGEQVSVSILAMILNDMGLKARSFLAHQIRIITDDAHSKARINEIETDHVEQWLEKGYIAVVAGFQGVGSGRNITTLGRGGTDLTAVALAHAFKADLCEIYTDVTGVFTTDPNICENAIKIEKISYEEMLEMASMGAKVLQTRSVEFAKKYEIPLMVRSTFSEETGTLVTKEDKGMEQVVVSGVTYNKNEAKISLTRVPDKPGIASKLFIPLAEANVNVDMIIQNISHDGCTDLTFTVASTDFKRALNMVEKCAKEIEAKEVIADEDVAKVSIVGAGMRSHAGVAARMFEALAVEGINIQMISTSEIKVSCVIDSKYTELAVRVLHDTFGLGEEDVKKEE